MNPQQKDKIYYTPISRKPVKFSELSAARQYNILCVEATQARKVAPNQPSPNA